MIALLVRMDGSMVFPACSRGTPARFSAAMRPGMPEWWACPCMGPLAFRMTVRNKNVPEKHTLEIHFRA